MGRWCRIRMRSSSDRSEIWLCGSSVRIFFDSGSGKPSPALERRRFGGMSLKMRMVVAVESLSKLIADKHVILMLILSLGIVTAQPPE